MHLMNSENDSELAFHADRITALIIFIAHTMITFA